MQPLLADVLSKVMPPNRRPSWLDHLTADLREEVEEIRRQYTAGSLGNVDATNLARAITQSLEARGMSMPQYKQVQRWLRDSPKK